MPHRRALPLAAVAASLLAGGCGENRSTRVLPSAQSDLAALRDFWNEGDLDAFVALADETRFLEDREQLAVKLGQAREAVGAIRHQADPIVDAAPEDPRAYAIAQQVAATENGVLHLFLAYDAQLRIVGFEVRVPNAPAAPR